jgi:hypothetical protein
MNLKINISALKIISIVYLAFPYLIFFMGWLKLPIGLFLSITLLAGLFIFAKNQASNIFYEIAFSQFIICFAIIIIWLLFSGAGGFGYQNHDYHKHNSLMKDLANQTWPVSYNLTVGKKYLSHYLAYYLPGPALFHSFGWKYINIANFLFSTVGALLSVFWLLRFVGKFSYWVVLLFIFASGAHIFILLYSNGSNIIQLITGNIKNNQFMFWLNCLNINQSPINNINFMSVSDMLYWGPQHAISCWLGIGLLMNDWKDKTIKYTPFYISLIAFWAPLVLIGLAPFLLYVLIKERFKGIFNVVNLLIAPIVFGVIALFLTSIKATELINHFIFHNRSSEGISTLVQIGAYLYFLTVEVLIWWVPSYLVLKNTEFKKYNGLYWLILLVLVTVPLFRYGQWNDWCSRVSLPALYLLYSMMAMAIYTTKKPKIKLILASICLICSFSPFVLIMASMYESHFKVSWSPPKSEFIGDLPSASVGFPVDQFVADPDCFFYKNLAKSKP